MKQVYQCEICEAVFDDEQAAERCEKNHKQVSTRMKYKPGHKFPYCITVGCGNDKIKYYPNEEPF